MPRSMVSAAVLACIACGGESSAVSLSGTIAGETMVAKDAISNIVAVDTAGTRKGAIIYIADIPYICTLLSAGNEAKNSKGILLALATKTASTVSPPATTGVYPVNPTAKTGNGASVYYWKNDANCEEATEMIGAAGTVTLTRIDASGYSGTFDITFEDGASHVTGNFNSSTCSAMDSQFNVGKPCI